MANVDTFLSDYADMLDRHATAIEKLQPAYTESRAVSDLLESHRRQLHRMKDEVAALLRKVAEERAEPLLEKAWWLGQVAAVLDDAEQAEEAQYIANRAKAKARLILEV